MFLVFATVDVLPLLLLRLDMEEESVALLADVSFLYL
jgi:hypothetical protein